MKLLLTLLVVIPLSSVSLSQSVWTELPSQPGGAGVTALEHSGDMLFATTGSFGFPIQDSGGVFRSTDMGASWVNLFPAYVARTIDIDDDGTIYASIWDWPNTNEGIYRSTDNGDSWQMVFDVGTNNNVFVIETGGTTLYAGTRTGVLSSSDGIIWSYDPSFPVSGEIWVRDLEVGDDGTPYAASYAGVYYKSLGNWLQVPGVMSGDSIAVVDIDTDGPLGSEADKLVLGSIEGSLYSGDRTGVALLVILFGEISGVNLDELNLAGVYSTQSGNGGMYDFTGKGYNDGLPSVAPVSGTDIIEAGESPFGTSLLITGFYENTVGGARIFTRELVTEVDPPDGLLPASTRLVQNYPNPFNSTSTFELHLAEGGQATLEVYDLLGQRVATIVDAHLAPGTHYYRWDASEQATGIYLYRLRAGSFLESRKLVLLR